MIYTQKKKKKNLSNQDLIKYHLFIKRLYESQ